MSAAMQSTSEPAAFHDDPDFVVIDVETACSRVSSLCQIGIVDFRDGREVFSYKTLLDPCDEFHAMNTRVHGIAAHHVVGRPTFSRVHPQIDRRLSGRTTVTHSYFDKGALAAACRVHDRAVIETTWLDSVRVAKRGWPELENHKLGALARYLGIPHRHHDALSDARAAGWVVIKAIDHTGMSLADWMAPPRRPAPRAAPDGPLRGEHIAILGEARDCALADKIAAAGGPMMSSVGATTTMLVVAGREPFSASVRASSMYRKAKDERRVGRALRIISVHALDLTHASDTSHPAEKLGWVAVSKPTGFDPISRRCREEQADPAWRATLTRLPPPQLHGGRFRYFPMMAERVLDPADAPAMLVRHRPDLPRAGLDRAVESGVRIVRVQDYPHG